MSQEYTENKIVPLKKSSSARRLLEVFLVVTGIFAIYLMVALVSFNPSDPSWSQTAWHEPINNLGGAVGAWLADTLLFIFGALAYIIPPVVLILCWANYRRKNHHEYIDYFSIALRLIGALALVLTSCGLAALNVDDIYYFASGGVIGSLLSNAMLPWLNGTAATLLLLCTWATGLTLFTGWSWLVIAEKIGYVVLNTVAFITNGSRKDDGNDTAIDKLELENEVTSAAITDDDTLLSTTAECIQIPASIQPLSGELYERPNEASVDKTSTVVADVASYSSQISPTITCTYSASADEHLANIVVEDKTPTLYPLEIPTLEIEHPADFYLDDEGPRLGDWNVPNLPQQQESSQSDFSAILQDKLELDNEREHTDAVDYVSSSLNTVKTFSSAATTHSATPAFTAVSDGYPQVKQGIGPELPRPNPVRIPTRRQLASYGIKIPSQRVTAEQVQHDLPKKHSAATQHDEIQHIEVQKENRLQQAFIEQQNQREAEEYSQEEADALQELALGQAFAQQQQARYGECDVSLTAAQVASPVNISNISNSPPVAESIASDVNEHLLTLPSQHKIHTEPREFQFEPVVSTSQTPPVKMPPLQQQTTPVTLPQAAMDSLIHPFLMRNHLPLEKSTTPLPTLDLLSEAPKEVEPVDSFELEQKARLVEACLADYRVKADVADILPGPVITRFELDLAPGVKAARISSLSRDLARSLSASAVRVVEVIPGKPYVGLELPNIKRQTVYLREVLDCPAFRDNPSPLTIVLGKDISGQPVVADLAKMPHLLVAGTTGSGKSVGVNAMILSILYKATPKEVRFIMIDPKMLELSVYEGIPHLLTDVVTDMKDAANALRWCVAEMERRYKLMSALGVRNLAGYNERVDQAEAMGRPIPDPFWKPTDSMDITMPVLEKEPYIVVMVDEFADLIMTVGKKVEELIARLAQKARAAGIHLVLATQRPSVDVITGLIKANIPTRIAFTVSSKIDSRTILDQSGAESLLGMGDMLYLAPNSSIPVRVHGAFVRDQEVHAVVNDWKARERPQYKEGILSPSEEGEAGGSGVDGGEDLDPLFDQAVEFVVDKRRASISGVQRQFRIGYNRAARIIEQMEAQGIVSEQGNNGNREVLAPQRHN